MRLTGETTIKTVRMILMIAVMSALMTMVCFASSSYAENGVKWLLDQAFWIIIGVTIYATAKAGLSRSITGAIISVLIGSFLAYLCKNPTVIETISNNYSQIIS